MRCSNNEKGCEWAGDLRSIDEHHSACDFTSIQCPNHCTDGEKEVNLLRKNLHNHLIKSCPKRQYQCPHCKKFGQYQERTTTHLQVCPQVKVSCLNPNCSKTVPRCKLKLHRSICPFEVIDCENCKLGCKGRFPRKALLIHIQNVCPKRKHICPHCKERGVYDQITAGHLNTCSCVELPCPNVFCTSRPLRRDVKQHRLVCEYEKVVCKYAAIGCNECLYRKDMVAHESSVQEHFSVAVETIQMLKEKVDYGEPCQYAPFHFKLTDFSEQKLTKKSDFYSKPFYTHPGGYRASINVCANGSGDGENTHISVYVYLMKGENDDSLSWPFTGTVTLRLLNQLEDENHCLMDIPFKLDNLCGSGSRVTGDKKYGTGWGFQEFISHSDVDHNSARNCQYLKDDCLYFRVDTKIERGWLFCE